MKRNVIIISLLMLVASCDVASYDRNVKPVVNQSELDIQPLQKISKDLEEISGVQYYAERFFGMNDSGGKPEIYSFSIDNPNAVRTIKVSNATNIDWEDIAMSDKSIFVGDFGNNIGNRKDQKIYAINKKNINPDLENQTVEAKAIEFFFPEQKVYGYQPYQHDFDVESMVYFNNEIHLFTKEWKSQKTHHYTLDLVKGTQPAWLVEEFDLGFLATGADVIKLDDEKSRLAIVGYNKKGEVFLMLTDFYNKSKEWFNNEKLIRKIGDSDELGQVEGITFINPKEFYISAEAVHSSEYGNQDQNICYIKINEK